MKSRSIRRYAGALLCSAPALSAAQQAATPATPSELDAITAVSYTHLTLPTTPYV